MRARRSEILPTALLAGCSLVAVGLAVAVVLVVAGESIAFFAGRGEVTIDVWALCLRTMSVSAVALLTSLPLGLAVAVTLRELASPVLRAAIRPWLALFATMPPLVFAYLAIALQRHLTSPTVPALTLGLLLAPFVARVFDTALRSAPEGMRDAALALGATRLEAWTQILLPASASGLVSAALLALVRALGESVIIAVASQPGPSTLAAEPLRAVLGLSRALTQQDLFVIAAVLVVATLALHRLASRFTPPVERA